MVATLSLVPLVPVTEDMRKMFWRLYLDWLSMASTDEIIQLDQVLARHAHEVRPLIDAVSDAIHADTNAGADALPHGLVNLLRANGWKPRPPVRISQVA